MFTRDSPGLIGDVSSLASNGLRAVRSRLELLTIELKEEKAWLVRFVIIAIAALYLVTFGLLLAIFALALYASEENRPMIVAIAAAVFLLAGAGGAAYIYLQSKKRHPIFDETIKVLKGDEDGLHKLLKGAGDD